MSRMSRRSFLKLTLRTAMASDAFQLVGYRSRKTRADSQRTWLTSGQVIPSLNAFDQTVRQFMQARNISSGALAVTRQSKLILARGYSWTTDNTEIVEPDSLFRIASLTKPFTSAAVMTLVQGGKLTLDQKVVDILDLKPPANQQVDPRLKNITVLHLLQHLGGWDRDTAFDPMFHDVEIAKTLGVKLPISTGDIITYMNGKPLQHDPGSTYVYSNYGYCILGRVIEKISNQSYIGYITDNLLNKLGIRSMVPGRSSLSLRTLGEVKYYSKDTGLYSSVVDPEQKVPVAYGTFDLENMDSHGRWLASAVDLVRFAKTFDNPTASEILDEKSIQTIFAVPAIGPNKDGSFYGCGWMLTPASKGYNTWHNGSLPGTSTLMVRRVDGLNWAVVFNQRDDPSGLDYGAIDPALHQAANAVNSWPDHDLFAQYYAGA